MRNWSGNRIGILALILTLSFAVYYNALWNPFHFDDVHHIQYNTHLRNIGNIPSYFFDMRTFSAGEGYKGHYRPVLLATHALNYLAGGPDPFGYHLVNLLFHVGTAFLIFLISESMLKKSTGSFFIALTAGVIFIVNPFNSEIVNYVSTRSSVMCSFFYLLSFYFWIKFREKEGVNRGVLRAGEKGVLSSPFYVVSLISFLLAMLTKEIAITLPVMLWLYDIYFMPPEVNVMRERLKDHFRKSYILIPYAAFVVIPYLLIRFVLLTQPDISAEPARTYTMPVRSFFMNLLIQPKVLLKNIQLFFIPVNLTVEHYISEVRSIMEPDVIMSGVLIIALLCIAVWLFRQGGNSRRVMSFFIAWFFIVQLPTSIIPLYATLQENRGYLAAVSSAVFFGFALNKLTTVNSLRIYAGKYSPVTAAVFLLLIVITYSAGTISRNRVWENDVTLWSDAVSKSPLSPRAHHNLSLAYNETGNTESAIKELHKVIELDPTQIMAYYNLGNIYNKMGMRKAAISEYGKALEIDPYFYQAHNNIGMAYWRTGEFERAIAHLKKAYEIKPEYGLALRNLEMINMDILAKSKAQSPLNNAE